MHQQPQVIHTQSQVIPQIIHTQSQIMHQNSGPQVIHSQAQIIHQNPQIIHQQAPQVIHTQTQQVIHRQAPQIIHQQNANQVMHQSNMIQTSGHQNSVHSSGQQIIHQQHQLAPIQMRAQQTIRQAMEEPMIFTSSSSTQLSNHQIPTTSNVMMSNNMMQMKHQQQIRPLLKVESGSNKGRAVNRTNTGRPPPGTVNLERSHQICQAVIQNSPNRHQLNCQLKPQNVSCYPSLLRGACYIDIFSPFRTDCYWKIPPNQ